MAVMFSLFTLLVAALATAQSLPSTCKSSNSQPNPVASQYPDDVTGTDNQTIVLMPIPYSVARAVIPQQYSILDSACRAVLPGFCAQDGVFPLVVQSVRVHGSGQGNFTLPDFSRFSVYYPFIDRLSDGYSSFSYQAGAVIEASATLAIEGFNAYGPPNATSGSFSPPCDPYASSADGTLSRTVYDSSGAQVAKLALQPQTTLEKFTLDVARNVTNQPVFGGNATVCDNFITLFNSTVSQGVFSPVPLKGTLQIGGALYPKNATCNDVEGWKIDLAFVERGLKACRSLKGYAGSGPGD